MEHPLHSHGDVMKSYLGLLYQGKSDFDHIMACQPREGKTMYIGAIKRTIDRDGQMLLIPDLEVNVYWTSLRCAP